MNRNPKLRWVINKVCCRAFNVRLAEDGEVSVRRYAGWPSEDPALTGWTSGTRSNRWASRKRRGTAVAAIARQLATPWGSYVRGWLKHCFNFESPGRGPDWCRELFRCLICESDNETELCPKFSLDLSLWPGPRWSYRIHEEYPQLRRMFYFLPLRGFVVDTKNTYM